MLNKLIATKPVYREQWAQCLHCLYGETLPMRQRKLDTFVGRDGCRHYGHFKQTLDGQVYHNCGKDVWRLCELYSDFRESDG